MHDVAASDVTVYVATLDTAAATELCIRTLHKYAGHPFGLVVGDSGSTDRSLSMLRRFEHDGWLTLEEAPGGRRHAQWLDHWLERCTTRYAVFVDSDMEFLADGWLADLVRAADRSGAAMVSSRMQELSDRPLTDRNGHTVRWAQRPTPWLMLVDVAAVKALGPVSFGFVYRDDPDPERAGDRIAYDTGALIYAELSARGVPCMAMPDGWSACYHHFGGMTWIRKKERARRARLLKQALKEASIRVRLQRARLTARRRAAAPVGA